MDDGKEYNCQELKLGLESADTSYCILQSSCENFRLFDIGISYYILQSSCENFDHLTLVSSVSRIYVTWDRCTQ